jgi:hypothetical protein
MDPQVLELIRSFESDAKKSQPMFNEFLAYVYTTFDKTISLCRSDRMMNKYKKMRMSILRYIVAHEKQIIKELSK